MAAHYYSVIILYNISFFKNKFIYFIFGCIGSSLLGTGFLQFQQAGVLFIVVSGLLSTVASLCCGARALGTQASAVVARGLSSCGAQAQLLCSMWDLPGPRLEPVSPALAGGFLTTAPPVKSLYSISQTLSLALMHGPSADQ